MTESLLEFPCTFPIKAMGRGDADFPELVLDIVGHHTPNLDRSEFKLRKSRKGNYLAVTVTIVATSRAQLDAIYQELSDNERVVMAL